LILLKGGNNKMYFKKGKTYLNSRGDKVVFVRTIKEDGMYNVFRSTRELNYRPFYTDKNGKTAYGESIIIG
jgi:hypothetical protein